MNEKRLLILSSILVVALIGMIGYQSYHIHQLTTHVQGIQTASAPAGHPTGPPVPGVTINPQPGSAPVDPFQSIWDDPMFGTDDWNPFQDIQRIQQQMDRMFASTLNRFNASPSFGPMAMSSTYLPELDVEDEGDHYAVTIDLPGLEDSQVDIQVDGRNLTLSGVREETTEEEDDSGKVIRRERNLGRFERSVTLPGPVDKDAVEANYEDGVLKITLPKSTDTEESRKIPLNTGTKNPAS